jgi:uncharacterized OsmC-like protein
MINGVDEEKLRSTIDQVDHDPAAGHYIFKATTTWDTGAHSITRIRNFTLESDEPPGLLGTDLAPNAVEQVLGALGGCLTVGIAYATAARGIQMYSLRFDIEGYLDIRGFFGQEGIHPGYERIEVTVHLESDAERKDLESLVDGVIKTSPVRDIITRGVPVRVTLAD